MAHWYAVHTKPRQESVAETHLQRQGFQIYLPRTQITRRRRDKWVKVVEPLFPRYLFVSIDVCRDNSAPIRSTRGVSGLVRFGDGPAVVPDEFMAALQASVDPATGLHPNGERSLNAGDKVVVIGGPFAGLRGLFQARTGEERVIILLNMLGRENKITVPRDAIAAAV